MNRQIQQWRVGVNKSKIYRQVQDYLKQNYNINKSLRNSSNPLNPYCRANNVSIEAVNEHVHSEEQLSRDSISTKDNGYYIKKIFRLSHTL